MDGVQSILNWTEYSIARLAKSLLGQGAGGV